MFGLVHRPKIYKIGCNITPLTMTTTKKYSVINKKELDLLTRFNSGQDSDVGDFFPNGTFP